MRGIDFSGRGFDSRVESLTRKLLFIASLNMMLDTQQPSCCVETRSASLLVLFWEKLLNGITQPWRGMYSLAIRRFGQCNSSIVSACVVWDARSLALEWCENSLYPSPQTPWRVGGVSWCTNAMPLSQ